MKPLLLRTSGVLLIINAFIGLLISLAGIIYLGRLENQVIQKMSGGLDLLTQTLTTSSEGLIVADESLGNAVAALGSLEGTLGDVQSTLDGSTTTLDSVAGLLGEDLPSAIRSTQGALLSAETTARNLDGFLNTISRIPFLGSAIYQPEVPLSEAIADISTSLNEIPASLVLAQENMDTTVTNLETVGSDVGDIGSTLGEVAGGARDARRIVQDYQEVVESLQSEMEQVKADLPGWLRNARLAASLVLVWLGITQIGLFILGWDLLSRRAEIA